MGIQSLYMKFHERPLNKIKNQLTIINYLRYILGKEFLYRSFVQKRSTQNSQHFVSTSVQLKVMLNNSHHTVCRNGCKYLDACRALSCSPKGLDFNMLLYTFEK